MYRRPLDIQPLSRITAAFYFIKLVHLISNKQLLRKCSECIPCKGNFSLSLCQGSQDQRYVKEKERGWGTESPGFMRRTHLAGSKSLKTCQKADLVFTESGTSTGMQGLHSVPIWQLTLARHTIFMPRGQLGVSL